MFNLEFYVEPIRETGRDGRLTQSGAGWSEERLWVTHLGLTVIWFLMMICILTTVMGSTLNKGDHTPWMMVAATLAAISTALWRLCRRFGQSETILLFNADGSITAPNGMPSNPFAKAIFGNHADIVSIEARKNSFAIEAQQQHAVDYEVCLFLASGTIMRVASNIQADQSHMIAVQLTSALRAMRQSYATVQTGRPKPQMKAPRERALID